MTHATDYPIHVQLSVGLKHDFQQNFSLKPQIASLVGVDRVRLVGDFDRVRRRTGIRLRLSSVREFLRSEAAGRDRVAASVAAAIAVAADGHAVAESRAGHRALHALRARSE